jgi:heterotetrameric sarcosine oxidase gamma subunit
MDSLSRTTVREQLGATEPAAAGVVVRVLDPAGQFFVTGGPQLAPNTRIGTEPYSLWLAPDRTLVVYDTVPETPDGSFVSDVTDGLTVFEIAGPRAHEIIAASCTVPHDAVTPGRCAQTLFGGVKVVLYAHGDGFRLHAERQFAAFLFEWLTQAVSALKE